MPDRKYFIDNILNLQTEAFESFALQLFEWQRQHVPVFKRFLKVRNALPPDSLSRISPLPVSFFKTHDVFNSLLEPNIVFTSSGTTGMVQSRHLVHDPNWYEAVFSAGFEKFFGSPRDYVFLFLLPSYLERSGSSLIYMCEKLAELSGNPESGFYLNAVPDFFRRIETASSQGKKTMIFGVTFALLDLAETNPQCLGENILMLETGGMKGRREEWVRDKVHQQLKEAFCLPHIGSEYGMTELMSQAYSQGNGIFHCPPWMRVMIRSEDDPGQLHPSGRGMLVIIDLANIDSCAFIETEDLGIVHPDGSFEVLGRIDGSALRGCSLLTA